MLDLGQTFILESFQLPLLMTFLTNYNYVD